MSGKTMKMLIGLMGCVLLLALASCGGGGDTANPINPGNNNGGPGGLQGDLGNGDIDVDPSDLPVAVPITGALTEAPLGTNPAFNVQEAGSESTKTSSKAASELPQGVNFQINWVAVAADGETPDPDAVTPLEFNEGDKIDLWFEYEVNDGTPFELTWMIPAFGFELNEGEVFVESAGTYQRKLDMIVPYNLNRTDGTFTVFMSPSKGSSVVTIPEDSDSKSDGFIIVNEELEDPITYPEDPDDDNDQQGGGGGCVPAWINVEFNGTSIYAESAKDLSNVVLEFDDGIHEKHDDLNQGTSGTFSGTGDNEGKTIVRAWVKSGCNSSGDGPGYGEMFEPEEEAEGMAQMGWEDLIVNSDYDYNDFVGRLRATELRNSSNELVQISLTVKAIARGAGYDADWQFNVDAAFPGADVTAIVDQYYADGTRHGPQRIWTSSNGASIPVFSPTRDALPTPPDHSFATNVVPGTTFIDGDYAEVTIVLGTPMAQGTYTPVPYEPQLRVQPNSGNTYIIGLWRQPGDPVDSNGRPLAFIIPDTYSWPNERVAIWNAYPNFTQWVTWVNEQNGGAPSPNWYDMNPISNKTFDIADYN